MSCLLFQEIVQCHKYYIIQKWLVVQKLQRPSRKLYNRHQLKKRRKPKKRASLWDRWQTLPFLAVQIVREMVAGSVGDGANSNINAAGTETRGHTMTVREDRSQSSKRSPICISRRDSHRRKPLKLLKILKLHKEVMGLKLHHQEQLGVRIGTFKMWSREKEAKVRETETDIVDRENKVAENRMDQLLGHRMKVNLQTRTGWMQIVKQAKTQILQAMRVTLVCLIEAGVGVLHLVVAEEPEDPRETSSSGGVSKDKDLQERTG